MVFWSEFRMGQSKDDDHRESIGMTHPVGWPHISLQQVSSNRKGFILIAVSQSRICTIDYVVDSNTKMKSYVKQEDNKLK